MDLSDILPLLIIIGGALLSFLSKSVKKKAGDTSEQPRRQPTPPVVHSASTTAQPISDDWIPNNSDDTYAETAIPPSYIPIPKHNTNKNSPLIQVPENEGQRSITEPTNDPNYAYNDNTSICTTQNWRKAIIAHEILKTKF